MGRIYCIMGKSSSGKDTIYKKLLCDKKLDLKKLIPYTTRPIRQGEKNGQEYFFIKEEDVKTLQDDNRVIEMRSYETCFGPWKYLTVHDEQINLSNQDFLMIGTPAAFLSVREYYGKDKVVPLLIELDDGIRLQRALNREKKQTEPKYDEMCRRYLADQKDFSEEELGKCEIEVRFYNEKLETCIQSITEYIMELKKTEKYNFTRE